MLPRELRQTLAESELRCAHAEGDEDPEMVPSQGSGFWSAGLLARFLLRGRPEKLEMNNKRAAAQIPRSFDTRLESGKQAPSEPKLGFPVHCAAGTELWFECTAGVEPKSFGLAGPGE